MQFQHRQSLQSQHILGAANPVMAAGPVPLLFPSEVDSFVAHSFLNPNQSVAGTTLSSLSSVPTLHSQSSLPSLHVGLVRDLMRGIDLSGLDHSITGGSDDGSGRDDGDGGPALLEIVPVATAYAIALLAGLLGNLLVIVTILFGARLRPITSFAYA